MNQRSPFILVASGLVLGLVLGVSTSYGQSGTKKHCGTAAGATNGTCPTCTGNCKFGPAGQSQKYKVCAGTPGTCKDSVNSTCQGILMTGGADGQGCDGTAVMDGTGQAPITCQNSPFKTCT